MAPDPTAGFAYPKHRRTEDRALLDTVKKMRCCVCGRAPGTAVETTPSHIKTRGSGGGDEYWNVVPKCVTCHIEWGKLGPGQFMRKHPVFRAILQWLGWHWDGQHLWHPKMGASNDEVKN